MMHVVVHSGRLTEDGDYPFTSPPIIEKTSKYATATADDTAIRRPRQKVLPVME
jgi:hypothetical protein